MTNKINEGLVQEISAEIGDVLWYIAVLTLMILVVSDIANANLVKLAIAKKKAQYTVLATKDSQKNHKKGKRYDAPKTYTLVTKKLKKVLFKRLTFTKKTCRMSLYD